MTADRADPDPDTRAFHFEGGVPVFDVGRVDKLEREARESRERDEQYKRDQISLNRRLVIFTGVLALVGIIGGGVSAYQVHISKINAEAARDNAEAAKDNAASARETVTEMKKGGTDTHNLADAAAKQADRMRDLGEATNRLATQAEIQAKAAARAAKAAEDAAITAQEAMHISERAYVAVGNPRLDFGSHTIFMNVNNSGRIPSGETEIIAHAVIANVVNPLKPTNIDVRGAIEKHWRHVRFSSVPVGTPFFISQVLSKMEEAQVNSGGQHIVYAGSVDYHDGFDKTPMQKSFFCVDSSFNVSMKQLVMAPCDEAVYLPLVERIDGYPNNEDR